jgi:hypothetical protein
MLWVGSSSMSTVNHNEQKEIKSGGEYHFMSEAFARLNAVERNIERYECLLNTHLSKLEVQYIEKQLAEERLKLAQLRLGSRGDEQVKRVA